jgi:hypothetical protein
MTAEVYVPAALYAIRDAARYLAGALAPLPALTSIGCYPLIYVTAAGDVLCADCATSAMDDDAECDPPIAVDTYLEGPDERCENCYVAIPSAYGNPFPEGES